MFKLSEYRLSYISDICSNLKTGSIETVLVLTNGDLSKCSTLIQDISPFRDLDNNQIKELPPQVFHNNSQLVEL